jgi:hypothetical protein
MRLKPAEAAALCCIQEADEVSRIAAARLQSPALDEIKAALWRGYALGMVERFAAAYEVKPSNVAGAVERLMRKAGK